MSILPSKSALGGHIVLQVAGALVVGITFLVIKRSLRSQGRHDLANDL